MAMAICMTVKIDNGYKRVRGGPPGTGFQKSSNTGIPVSD